MGSSSVIISSLQSAAIPCLYLMDLIIYKIQIDCLITKSLIIYTIYGHHTSIMAAKLERYKTDRCNTGRVGHLGDLVFMLLKIVGFYYVTIDG